MIDLVYKTVQTILNKDNQGFVSPREYNLLAKQVQDSIFRSYFENANRDKSKQVRGLTNQGYSDLAFNERQRINQFSEIGHSDYSPVIGGFGLTNDVYFLEKDGITWQGGAVIEEVQRHEITYLNNSIARPTAEFPVYERYGNHILTYPNASFIGETITFRYIREPKNPKWTYLVVNGTELYNPSATDHQDFELHTSEFPKIVIMLVGYFGINLRETEVVQISEIIKDKGRQEEEG